LQAAVLGVKLQHLEHWCAARIERATAYHKLFQASGLVGSSLKMIPPLITDKSHVFNNYVVRAARRDELKEFLAERGIQSEIYYPLPLHLQKCFAALDYRCGDFPEAERAAAEVLALPLYPELNAEQQDTVVGATCEFYYA
jgi:dTDP-4-amino-4,6-dideoxygalactose transaminase